MILKVWYWLMFIAGVIMILFSPGSFTWGSFSEGFPVAAILIASYLWIRLDVWRTNKTIKDLTGSTSVKNPVIIDLISRSSDCRMALFLIVLGLIIQATLLKPFREKGYVFLCSVLILTPISNLVARILEKIHKKKYSSCQMEGDSHPKGADS